jgi:soluble lytic murein transglycosylase-like protein
MRNTKLKILTLTSLLIFPMLAFAGPVYVYKQADGVTRFTTKKPEGVKAQVFSAKGAYSKVGASYHYSNNFASYKASHRHKMYKSYISAASARYGVSSDLLSALIHAESSFNPQAVSKKGALGLMQLMPYNARKLGLSNPFSPVDNIHAGTQFFSRLLIKYRGNEKLALAAYNAGEGAVKKYGGIPPYPETQTYVTKVLALKEQYRRVMYG